MSRLNIPLYYHGFANTLTASFSSSSSTATRLVLSLSVENFGPARHRCRAVEAVQPTRILSPSSATRGPASGRSSRSNVAAGGYWRAAHSTPSIFAIFKSGWAWPVHTFSAITNQKTTQPPPWDQKCFHFRNPPFNCHRPSLLTRLATLTSSEPAHTYPSTTRRLLSALSYSRPSRPSCPVCVCVPGLSCLIPRHVSLLLVALSSLGPAMNPRVEEVSDSDSDPEEMDISNLSSLMTPSHVPASSSMSSVPPMPHEMLQPHGPGIVSANRDKSKHYQCLYPVYFDKSRTRAEGRRVGAELAVENPLAREMADAAASLGLSVVFEPDKLHPKDWSNPGRIRVLIKQNGRMVAPNIHNKHHLYILVSKYLKDHPTQKNSPFRLPIRGVPIPDEMPEPAVPKGWKMNTILPLHSPALTGGGVSDNFLQDMMAEMQGDMGAVAGGGMSGSKKKEKKKK